MNTNLYFLIQNINGSVSILNGPDYLPVTFLNVSNFSSLEQTNPQLIKNLGWLDRPDLGFWVAEIGSKPAAVFSKTIVSENIINETNETVTVVDSEVELTPQQQEEKKQMTFCTNGKERLASAPFLRKDLLFISRRGIEAFLT